MGGGGWGEGAGWVGRGVGVGGKDEVVLLLMTAVLLSCL